MRQVKTLYGITTIFAAFFMINCSTDEPQTTINMEPFIAMARGASCAEIANRLYTIDDSMVFWRREGNCADHGFEYVLFGDNMSTVFCRKYDSISPQEVINDSTYIDLFHTIISNLNDIRLGLGSSHSVNQIEF